METYILQKDLPDSKVGDKYILDELTGVFYKNGNLLDSYWTRDKVENNQEWFQKQELFTLKYTEKEDGDWLTAIILCDFVDSIQIQEQADVDKTKVGNDFVSGLRVKTLQSLIKYFVTSLIDRLKANPSIIQLFSISDMKDAYKANYGVGSDEIFEQNFNRFIQTKVNKKTS